MSTETDFAKLFGLPPKEPEYKPSAGAVIASLLIGVPMFALLWGWFLDRAWAWFVVPTFGLRDLPFALAVGLSSSFRALMCVAASRAERITNPKPLGQSVIEGLVFWVLAFAQILIVSWFA